MKLYPSGSSIKRIVMVWVMGLAALPWSAPHAQDVRGANDSSSHTVRFITADKDVKLEVLDWGGSGPSLVFLAGLTDNAHVFDKFAPKFTDTHHVYGITRRGFGASSAPAPADGNYSSDRLADDVLAVVDALKLGRPILVGHSFAGAELSSIGSRHPEKVAGLIYLDAIWPYSYYDRSVGNMRLDALELKRNLDELLSGVTQRQRRAAQELQTNLAHFEKVLQDFQKQLASYPAPAQDSTPAPLPPPILHAISLGWQKYTEIRRPILAIVAVPHDVSSTSKNDPSKRAAAIAADRDRMSALANGFEAGVPSAHVVRLPNADHYIFNSNEAEVLREMSAFLAKLP